MTSHWGDIPVVADADSGIAAMEREQLTKARPVIVEGPQLHQPTSQLSVPQNESHPAELFAIDSVTLHTIKLVQYARKVRIMIQNVQHQLDSLKSGENEMPTFPGAPGIPEFQGAEPKHVPEKPLRFLPKDLDSPFVRGLGQAPPEVDSKSCRRLLRRSVAAVCAHAGYDTCGESVLETLTDVCGEYMTQMTQLMRHAVDNEARNGDCGFPDVMEQVFEEMGVGSTRSLHHFYQQRVLNYHHHMIATCEQLKDDYEKVRDPELKLPDDSKPTIRVKEEPLSDIQFPQLDDAEDAEGDTLQLEASLSLDMEGSSSSLPNEDDGTKWQQTSVKSEAPDNKLSGLESLDGEGQSGASEGVVTPAAPTPSLASEGAESMGDPGSVSDIMSPPSVGGRSSGVPPSKKKKLK